MQINYRLLFSLNLVHSYFKNGVISSLSCYPNQATQGLLQRYAIKLVNDSSGLKLYARTNESMHDFLAHIAQSSEITSFEFDIAVADGNFYNYTNLPLDFNGLLVYSSDDALNQDNNGNVTLSPNYVHVQNERNIGTLKINFKDLQKRLGTNDHASFEISFKARAVHWQYYIINNSQLNIENMRIKNSTNIQFSDPVTDSLPTGQKALVMTSETLILLSEIPKHKNELIAMKMDSQKIILTLPSAEPTGLTLTEINGKEVLCAAMYMYL